MRDYNPKRRTAVVFTGSGSAGAYHAGALRALDESGVKIDLVVGSGVGTLAAAFSAVAGSSRLYGKGGFWDGVSWSSFYRLRPALHVSLTLLAAAFGVFLLPLLLALLRGLLFPLAVIVDLASPGLASRWLAQVTATPEALRGPYLAALAAPVFVLSLLTLVVAVRLALKRRRAAEAFESILDVENGRTRLARALWEVGRGPTISARPPSERELSKRFVSLLAENLGQPGFRELILRAADLETGRSLPFVLLEDAHRTAFAAARSRGPRPRVEGLASAVDLRAPGADTLLFDAVLTGILPALATAARRVSFPRGGIHGGETHRLTDACLVSGCGVAEAVAAGAEQVIVVSATPAAPSLPARRRGPKALADAVLATLERQAVDPEIAEVDRINRLVETLGHRTEDGGRAWQDPVTGRLYRSLPVYVLRPEFRALGPLELDGALDPASEVEETTEDLMERGYKDAYRLFVEPVVGSAPEPRQPEPEEHEEGQPVEL
jgi:hypothetical protein